MSFILENKVMEDHPITAPLSLVPEDEDMTADREANQMKKTPRLSVVSKKYDVGAKGYLDEEERILRAYDTNNDGNLDANELKKIVQDLRQVTSQKSVLRKILIYSSVAVVISILCNFALVWTALALTTQLRTQQGHLVDSQGNKVITQVGRSIVAKPNPEYLRRYLKIQRRNLIAKTVGDEEFDFQDEFRRLTEDVPVAELDDVDSKGAQEIFQDYQDGTLPTVSVPVNGITYTGSAASGATHTENSQGCDVYDKVREQGTLEPTYRVECCDGSGNSTCRVYENYSTGNRLLGNDADYCCLKSSTRCFQTSTEANSTCGANNYYVKCFSSISTVVEKKKGKMLMKDLSMGDFILAADGKYQPVLFSIHSNPLKSSTFVQIITTDSDGATPFEATPNHLVFLYNKDKPIQVGNVKVGDVMVGIDGPKIVSEIKLITRDGFYSPFTGDATLFVNGILASSVSVEVGIKHGFEKVKFGPFEINIHTLASWVAAPLINAGCTLVNSFFCDAQVEDGEGGSYNLMIGSSLSILTLSPVMQAIIYPSILALTAIGILTYAVALFLLMVLVIMRFSFLL